MDKRIKRLMLAFPVALLLLGSQRMYLYVLSDAVLDNLAAENYAALAEFVHPVNGVRFSPYAYVDLKNHVVLSRQELRTIDAKTAIRTWGTFDGSGEPITMSFESYFESFVYDGDFSNATYGSPNERIGTGNSLNNIVKVYEGRKVAFIEYHLPGSKKYDGMDWRSLRLVFEWTDRTWYLIGLVHDQWTI